ncbi:MAG: nicotinamide riboside transporter PnuC [Streptococcaceae bacterium]|jgi:nicotinamide mononucleotide transporter|nr:nicotinamide riboside transporter PnuC [Streptococcaceae bacterium]
MENTKQHSWLYKQLFSNFKRFEVTYITILLAFQLLVYAIAPDTIIGMISGVFGVLCLVYGMKGRKINFAFGLFQTCAMTIIAFQTHSWMSFVMGIFYTLSQPIGWFMWGRDDKIRSFSKRTRLILFSFAIVAWLVVWAIDASLHGQLPYFDALNLVIPIIAQVLYVLKYQENWSLWIPVNVAAFIYWTILLVQFLTGHNTTGALGMYLSQAALQGALLFNAIYASRVWASGEADNEGGTK